jgi:ribonuclease G
MARSRSCYSRICRGKSHEEELIQRYGTQCSVLTDIRSVYEKLSADYPGIVRFYDDDSWPLIKLKGLEAELERALGKAVWLPSGGRLFIEQTEAMTVIDVNSGKSVGKNQKEAHLFKINSEAVRESMRQIRLRNLSGIIMIDLINMKNKEHIEAIAQQLKEQSYRDPVQTTFVDITGLQIAELTRKKQRRTLQEQMRKN